MEVPYLMLWEMIIGDGKLLEHGVITIMIQLTMLFMENYTIGTPRWVIRYVPQVGVFPQVPNGHS
jgi:hypothetical protein